MSCVSWYSGNLVVAPGTVLTASSEDAFFPIENIKHDFTTKVWRTPSGTLTGNVIFDFKTIEPIDSVLVAPDSTQGFGFDTLTIEANGTSNFTSPAFSASITVNHEFDLGISSFSTQNYRFWRLSGSGVGDFFEISKVFIGSKVNLTTNNIDFNWTFENTDRSTNRANRYAQKFVDVINNQKKIRAQYKLLNISEVETMLGVFEYHGTHRPLWMVVDEDENIISDAERFAGYFYFVRRPRITNSAFGLYDVTFELEEAK